MESHTKSTHYHHFFLMVFLSFVAMYILMYAMVDKFVNVLPNLNHFYMVGLMTMPMIIIEIIMMRSMYNNKKLNIIILSASVVAGLLLFLFIRQQTGISDRAFLRSMIPHHAGAVLMCENAKLTDPDIKELCTKIISSQQQEIDRMKTKLQEISK